MELLSIGGSMEKSKNENKISIQGLGFCNVLTIVFVIAKLTGYVNWSWWIVFLPTIAGLGLQLLILFGVFIFAALAIYFDE